MRYFWGNLFIYLVVFHTVSIKLVRWSSRKKIQITFDHYFFCSHKWWTQSQFMCATAPRKTWTKDRKRKKREHQSLKLAKSISEKSIFIRSVHWLQFFHCTFLCLFCRWARQLIYHTYNLVSPSAFFQKKKI